MLSTPGSAQTAQNWELFSSDLKRDLSRLKTIQAGDVPPLVSGRVQNNLPIYVVLLGTTQGSMMELARDPEQNAMWSCEASSAEGQACRRGMDLECPAPNAAVKGKRRPYGLQPGFRNGRAFGIFTACGGN